MRNFKSFKENDLIRCINEVPLCAFHYPDDDSNIHPKESIFYYIKTDSLHVFLGKRKVNIYDRGIELKSYNFYSIEHNLVLTINFECPKNDEPIYEIFEPA